MDHIFGDSKMRTVLATHHMTKYISYGIVANFNNEIISGENICLYDGEPFFMHKR